MKIVICASVVFSDKIIEITKELEKLGHSVDIPFMTKKIATGEVSLESYKLDKEKEGDTKYRREYEGQVDFIKRYYKLISECDAVLVLNYKKKDVDNYIGGSVLMEIGFAYAFDKKIYLLNEIPDMSYTDEIISTKPIIINGDLSRIK